MAESIGAVRVDIIGNADDLRVEVERAKTLVSSMGPEFEKSFGTLNQSQQQATIAALKFEQQIGKSKDELRLLSLAARGAAPEAIEKLRLKMLETRSASERMSSGLSSGGKSAKEMAFAMRGLPAQLTDITVGLATGQRPLMVLLQQGGQLKDMFGGIRPAATALAGALRGLFTATNLTAGGVALLGAAWLTAENRAASFERTVITTGNRLDLSADKLSAFKDELASLAGVSEGQAADAINEVALAGGFTQEQFKLATKAAVEWQAATGTAISETVQQFQAIQRDPLQALTDLRSKYGGVTQAQIAHVQQLIDEGNEQQAVTEAFRAWADIIDERAPQIQGALDPIDKIQKSLADNAKAAWDAIGNGIHNAAREAQEGIGALGRFLNAVNFLRAGPGGIIGFNGGLSPPAAVSNAPPVDPTDQAEADYAALLSAVYAPAAIDAANRYAEAWVKAGEKARQQWDQIKGKYDSANGQLQRQIALFDDSTHAAAALYDTEKGALSDLPQKLKDVLIARARNLDALEKERDEWREWQADMDALDKVRADVAEDVVNAQIKAAREGADKMTEFNRQAARNMQSDFADFLFDPFEDGVDGMVENFAKALQRMFAEMVASDVFKALANWGQNNSDAGGFTGFFAKLFGAYAEKNANGGVYSSPSLAAYSGTVVNKPTLFAFANGGALGVMGEAGEEGIFPLKRGRDGKLGVRAEGGGLKIEVNNYGGSRVSAREETVQGADGQSLRKVVIDIFRDDFNSGGATARDIRGRFGLREAV
jgi:lambda family phage tail tape measure protein